MDPIETTEGEEMIDAEMPVVSDEETEEVMTEEGDASVDETEVEAA